MPPAALLGTVLSVYLISCHISSDYTLSWLFNLRAWKYSCILHEILRCVYLDR